MRECVEHQDFRWAQEESKRIVRTCDGFLTGDGEEGDCEQSVAGDVSWPVPTGSNSTILIRMVWGDDPSKLTCSVSTAEELSGTLKELATRVAQAQSLEPQSAIKSDEAVWIRLGNESEVRLTLRGYGPAEPNIADPSFDTKGQWEARGLALQRQHPYQLEYRAPSA
jgi:hypothetical protein